MVDGSDCNPGLECDSTHRSAVKTVFVDQGQCTLKDRFFFVDRCSGSRDAFSFFCRKLNVHSDGKEAKNKAENGVLF